MNWIVKRESFKHLLPPSHNVRHFCKLSLACKNILHCGTEGVISYLPNAMKGKIVGLNQGRRKQFHFF